MKNKSYALVQNECAGFEQTFEVFWLGMFSSTFEMVFYNYCSST